MKVQIEAKGLTELLTWDGETIVVSRHGALILTSVPLRVGMSSAGPASLRRQMPRFWKMPTKN
jgi:hypothetical protein